MSEFNAPRRGSMAYYPRVRAEKETPSLKAKGTENKALSFLCYKVGMVQAQGKNIHKASPTFGQEVIVPATVVACPPLKVFALRAYVKDQIGVNVLSDVIAENTDRELSRKMNNFKKPSQKKKDGKNAEEKNKEKDDAYTIEDFEKEMGKIQYFTLLVHTQPKLIDIKKTPDIVEINIGGTKEEQFAYGKEKLGKEIAFDEVFQEKDFLDVRAVTHGKGIQGPVKRMNVRSLRPKNKRVRVVGSIGPWHPNTVMFTVARPGQMGYQNRTEYNKKLIKISDKTQDVNPSNGFTGFGLVKGKYALIFGSVPGAIKRCVALRKTLRPDKKAGVQLEAVDMIVKH